MAGRRSIALSLVALLVVGCAGAAPTAAPPTSAPPVTPAPATPVPATPVAATPAPPTATPTLAPTATPTTAPTDTPSPTPPPTPSPTPTAETFTSDDSLLALDVPFGAFPPGTAVTIKTKGKADAPPELANVTFRSAFYGLDAAGAQPAVPLTIRKKVDFEALELDPLTDGLPIVGLASRSADGTWEWLEDQNITFDGTTLTTTATTSHLSDFYGFQLGASIRVSYTKFASSVRDPFFWDIDLVGALMALDPDARPILAEPFGSVGDPAIARVGAATLDDPTTPTKLHQEFECLAEGATTVQVMKQVRFRSLPPIFGDTLKLPNRITMGGYLWVPLTCGPAQAAIKVTGFCVTIAHPDPITKLPRPPAGYFSLTAPTLGLDVGSRTVEFVEIVITGVSSDPNDGVNLNMPLVITNPPDPGFITIDGGIRSKNDKTVKSIHIKLIGEAEQDITDQALMFMPGGNPVFQAVDNGTTGTCPPSI